MILAVGVPTALDPIPEHIGVEQIVVILAVGVPTALAILPAKVSATSGLL